METIEIIKTVTIEAEVVAATEKIEENTKNAKKEREKKWNNRIKKGKRKEKSVKN